MTKQTKHIRRSKKGRLFRAGRKTKVEMYQSNRHTFLDVQGPRMNIFRAFDTEEEARKHLNMLKKSKYWE